MTTLTITPKIADKTARFKGAVAAGEHVAVTIKGGAAWLGDDNGEHLSLRVLDLVTGRTLAMFPRPPETLEDGDDPDEWSASTEDPNDLFCNLNLNTDRMVNAARHMLRVPVLFVMGAKDEDNPATTRTLYFRDRHEVEFWPERVGDDTPYDLDRWPKQIDEWTELIAEFETRIDAAEDSIRDAVDEADGIVAHVDAAKTAAQNSATAAGSSASAAQGSAATAKNWATGGGETGDPGATNNAKYYAQQAGASAASAEGSATSAEASATAAANSATAASGSATSAASSAQSAAGAAEAAVETEKERAEGAESDLADAIDAEKERAEGAEALAIVNVEYNGASRRIVFTTGGGETKTIDASAFIKDGMISSVSVSNGNLVITFNSDAGKQPISIPLTQIFNPSNYYDKTTADGTFVKKDGAKGLSTNDYTTAEKQKLADIESGAEKNVGVEFTQAEKTKLSGIAEGANNYTLPAASAETLGGVKQGTGCTIASDGTLNVTGGGGETPIAPSTDASAAGKPADAKATGDALADKRNLDDFTVNVWRMTKPDGTDEVLTYDAVVGIWASGNFDLSYSSGLWFLSDTTVDITTSAPESAASLTFTDGTSVYSLVRASRLAFDVEVSGKQAALSAQQLAAANSGATAAKVTTWDGYAAQIAAKADAADLRYALVTPEIVSAYSVPDAWFPIEFTRDGSTYTVPLADKDTVSLSHGVGLYLDTSEGTIASFDEDGVFVSSMPNVSNLQFNGAEPVVGETALDATATATLADRTVNLITATDETSIDIELPAAVTVDGVRYCRDFILDVDNSANASDLALEFTKLGVDYAFVPLEDDSISEMMTIGAGKRVRLYFTETPYITSAVPVINVARVTLGDFVTSTATQGGN